MMLQWRTAVRYLGWLTVGCLGLALLAAFHYIYPVLSDPEPDFLPRKGELRESRVTRTWEQAGDRFEEVTLISTSGLQVEISIRRPLGAEAPLPVVVLLGGFRTGRNAGALLPGHYPAVIASLSYPYAGDRGMHGTGLLRNIPPLQQALRDTTPAVLLSLDYLLQQADADAAQVELVGVSLGAFLAPPAGALDERISRVWLVQGAGDPGSLYAHQLRDRVQGEWWREMLAGVMALLSDVHHLAPEHWVGRIAPRPVVAINSRQDAAFPPANVQVLHRALGEPHEIIWLEEGGHVRPDEAAIIRQLSEIVLRRISAGPD